MLWFEALTFMDTIEKIRSKKAVVGVIGLGYVGLPLVIEFCRSDFNVYGFDTDDKKIDILIQGKSYIKHIDETNIKKFVNKKFFPSSDFSKLTEVDCILICVPTPLNKYRTPDLSFVFSTANVLAKYLKKGQLIVLESTTYPGTTDEELKKILLEKAPHLTPGNDFYLAYSPEREDPNNKDFSTKTIPKIVGGYTEKCLETAIELYNAIVDKTVPVSSTKVAEATKLLENIYRAVNIALVNELKIIFDKMDIDIWEVIEAAKTKPFGFQPFYPGPGLGGHCIPVDPFYLTWKAKEYDFSTRFIELAGEVNTYMPYYVIEKIKLILDKLKKTMYGAKILVLGVAYKKDVDDQRESPSLKIISLLKANNAQVFYYDTYVPVCKNHRHYPDINMTSIELSKDLLNTTDLCLLLTDHSNFDYRLIEKYANIIVDTRNAFASRGIISNKIHKV